jgi:L-threonylcarbamoyladenylate synthase
MRINLAQATQLLQQGHVVAVPTETVYGLAAAMSQLAAIEMIFTLKGRPRANPLIIHVANLSEIFPFVVDVPPSFEALANTFWPGPMTCILPVKPGLIPPSVCAGLTTAGFRIPASTAARDLIQAVGPLVMPSANLSGRPSSTSPAHVEEDFGEDFPVLEGDLSRQGVESTILIYDAEDAVWKVIRLGALPPDVFEAVLGYQPTVDLGTGHEEKPLCPGMLFRHYAPRAKLYLGGFSRDIAAKCILGFDERSYPKAERMLYLGSLNHPEEVAERLYDILRELDRQGIDEAYVDMDFPTTGLWLTIAERLHRAGVVT